MKTKTPKTPTLNERQLAVLGILKDAESPMTLAEISEKVGFEVKSGTTNTLVSRDYMRIAGTRENRCPCCGRPRPAKEYVLGENKLPQDE